MTGIYKIENKVTGQVYIGQSTNIKRRFKDHMVRAFNNFPSNEQYNNELYIDLRRYGKENFTFMVIEECQKEELKEKEAYWIGVYNSYLNGYNLNSGHLHQEATIKFDETIIKEIQKILLESNITYEEIHKKYNISFGRISDINQGRLLKNNLFSYPLRSKKRLLNSDGRVAN